MSLAEIEAELPTFSKEELGELIRKIEQVRAGKGSETSPRVFTGYDAARWWAQREHLPEAEAEAFADDIEKAYQLMNQPPQLREWGP